MPDDTILIENPAAVTSDSKHPKQAKAFLDFLLHARGAEDLRRERLPPGGRGRGHRGPELPDARPACSPSQDLGGWTHVATKFFDADKGIVAAIERSLGVSVEK